MNTDRQPGNGQRKQLLLQRKDSPFRRAIDRVALEKIVVKGAEQHNLKHMDVAIPRNKLVVLTGVSGSGKSSLAFDTIYAEGQRRYVEALSTYARQYVEQIEKPKVEYIAGLSPAIAIEQKTVSNNPRSTVGTLTEITNFLRLLYSRIGIRHCLQCETSLLHEADVCPACGTVFPPLSAAHFSPNTAQGMCPECQGMGTKMEIDPDLVIDQPHLSLLDGACRWHGDLKKSKSKYTLASLVGMAQHYGVDLTLPWQELPEQFRNVVLYGSNDEKIKFSYQSEDESWQAESERPIKGIIYNLDRLFRTTRSESTRLYYASFMSKQRCSACKGTRLCPEGQAVLLGGKSIGEVLGLSIDGVLTWLADWIEIISDTELEIASEALGDLSGRLQFLIDVGLHYLTLDRPAPTLSGGEGQRVRLASQIGVELVGLLYVLDEPSIGLHPRDHRALIEALCHIRDMGNTVLLVEHDEETMRAADWLIDIGPGAGIFGGEVVAEGTPEEVMANPRSLTGKYLRGVLRVTRPEKCRVSQPGKEYLQLVGARLHNLRHVDATFPLGLFTCVTGVSGSGKSSLISGTLHPALQQVLHHQVVEVGPYERMEGSQHLKKVLTITQEPIGRTPRSNPATYSGVFDTIRELFALESLAKSRGYDVSHFSFNSKTGACEECQGFGQVKVNMHFLSEVWVTCRVCQGMRFKAETLEVRYRGKTISEVLDLDVQQALTFFKGQPRLVRILQTMHDVGLDYIKLGQPATTLSGGEAQRLKLASELSRPSSGRTLYILDEPTTGLHFQDIQRLLDILHTLVDRGNTVIVIEHNLDVISNADWIVDLGPEGGDGGGQIIAVGPPEAVAQVEASHTGAFLRELFQRK